MEAQPIERRKLTLFSSGQEVGYINLWIEMQTIGNKRDRLMNNYRDPIIWDVSSMPEQEFELRVIVWETHEVPNNDPEDMSDIYVKVAMNSLDDHLTGQTDTHIRASNGFVSLKNVFQIVTTLGLIQLESKIPNQG